MSTTLTHEPWAITCLNQQEYQRLIADIFDGQEYQFETANPTPIILDVGAHIGVATLYFKQYYPRSRITCFEPNPTTFKVLQQNITQNQLQDVATVNAAVGNQLATVDFYISRDQNEPWSWGDSTVKNAWYSKDTTQTISVPQVKLSTYITQPIDLLKLDIEGLETVVMTEIEPKLDLVKELYLEFHGSSSNPTNQFAAILDVLNRQNFTYTLKQNGEIVEEKNIDQTDPYWLIIHAWREASAI